MGSVSIARLARALVVEARATLPRARGRGGVDFRGFGRKTGPHPVLSTLTQFSRRDSRARTGEAIRRALEAAGVEFTNGERPGVRLRVVGQFEFTAGKRI